MEYITLNNGVKMPVIGYGTYQTPASITEKVCYRSNTFRVSLHRYGTVLWKREEVGIACRKSGIPREELFITYGNFGRVVGIKIHFVLLKAL